MKKPLSLFVGALLASANLLSAQIPAAPSPTAVVYRARGEANGPFSVEVIDARRSSGQTLVVRLALRNDGPAPLAPTLEFANPAAAARTPADARRISGLHLVDPNGQKRFDVLRDSAGVPQCSVIEPALAPGERREVSATFPAPPTTSNTVNVFFPNTTQAIVGVPIGLSAGGEPTALNKPLTPQTAPAVAPSPPSAVSASTPPAGFVSESNYKPNVFPNQLPGSAPAAGSAKKAIGHIQASNSDVPFTVEVLSLQRAADGHLDLRILLSNDSTGPLDVGNYFTGGLTDSANARRISGVYLLEPATKARYEVARDGQNRAQCSEVNPPLAPGEKRELTARLAGPPASGVTPPPRSLYLYFPQASPIPDVPIGQ